MKEHIERSRFVGKHIAIIHDIDLYSVDLAIATHDLAKNLTSTELIDECEKIGIVVEAEYLLAPQLLHGPVAASWLENKHKVTDKCVIEAVQYHTTGYPDMGPVAKVVFLADKLDKEKIKRNPELEKVLSISESDLDAAVLEYINIQINSNIYNVVENSHQIMKIMLRLNKELSTSFVFATHDEKIMGYLRRILHLEDGEIIKDEKIDQPKFGE